MRKIHFNRRELLLFGGATVGSTLIVLPRIALATIPPPPISNWYLLFIADGIYRISDFYKVTLPYDAGTCQNYDDIAVSQAVRATFVFTGPHGVSPFRMLVGANSYDWWEVYDKRNGRYFRIWKYERFEVIFRDNSRVKVVFNGRDASTLFWPLEGTERLPDGTRLDGRTGVYRPAGGHKSRDDGGGNSLITPIIPSIGMYSTSHGSQVTPW